MAGGMSMLTETAFVMPGTKVAVPRWAVLGVGGALIVILLLVNKAGSSAAAAESEGEEGEGGGGIGDFIDQLIDEMNLPQPGEIPGDVVTPIGTPGERDTPPTEVFTPVVPYESIATSPVTDFYNRLLQSEDKYGSDRDIVGGSLPPATRTAAAKIVGTTGIAPAWQGMATPTSGGVAIPKPEGGPIPGVHRTPSSAAKATPAPVRHITAPATSVRTYQRGGT